MKVTNVGVVIANTPHGVAVEMYMETEDGGKAEVKHASTLYRMLNKGIPLKVEVGRDGAPGELFTPPVLTVNNIPMVAVEEVRAGPEEE